MTQKSGCQPCISTACSTLSGPVVRVKYSWPNPRGQLFHTQPAAMPSLSMGVGACSASGYNRMRALISKYFSIAWAATWSACESSTFTPLLRNSSSSRVRSRMRSLATPTR